MLFLCVQVSAQQRKTGQRRATTSVRKTSQKVIKTRQVGDDGFVWYKLKKGNKYGATDVEGNIIIPIKYSSLFYHTDTFGSHFYVTSGDFQGVYSRLGKCIISPDKHFVSIIFWKEKSNSFCYFIVRNKLGERGLYDVKGNEVIAPDSYQGFDLNRRGTISCIAYETYGRGVGAYDLNGNSILAPTSKIEYTYDIEVYPDKIKLNLDYPLEDEYIYGSYSENTRFDYGNYDGLYKPFKSTSSSSSSSSSSSHSEANSSSSKTTTPSTNTNTYSAPTRQLQPVQEWQPCLGCGGTGLCTGCQGKGKRWYGNSYENCVICHGNMYCQQCYGRKGSYITVLR